MLKPRPPRARPPGLHLSDQPGPLGKFNLSVLLFPEFLVRVDHGLSSRVVIIKWVHTYEAFGIELGTWSPVLSTTLPGKQMQGFKCSLSVRGVLIAGRLCLTVAAPRALSAPPAQPSLGGRLFPYQEELLLSRGRSTAPPGVLLGRALEPFTGQPATW